MEVEKSEVSELGSDVEEPEKKTKGTGRAGFRRAAPRTSFRHDIKALLRNGSRNRRVHSTEDRDGYGDVILRHPESRS